VSRHFLAGNALNLAGLDFLNTAGNYFLPSGIDFRLADMQIFGQPPHEFTDLFRRPATCFLNNLIRSHRHDYYHARFRLRIQLPMQNLAVVPVIPAEVGEIRHVSITMQDLLKIK
jgi:hypothetical protein